MTGAAATWLYRAGAIRDAAAIEARPGTVAVRNGQIVWAGPTGELRPSRFERPRIVDLPQMLLLPAMVNAHAHLDLTAIGPMPYGGDFLAWLRHVMDRRPAGDTQICDAVRRGAAMSVAAGVGTVGDIANSTGAVEARLATGLAGVSYLECFGLGPRQDGAAARLEADLLALGERMGSDGPVRLGIQPHAPYSAGPALYERATQLGCALDVPLSTHLCETEHEHAFTKDGSGPLVDHLEAMGKWDGSLRPNGLDPVRLMAGPLRRRPWLLAHCNYVRDDQIAILAECPASVAYCPVASEYFGHRDHRYRQMLDAGVNVAIGTDSILCQGPDEAQPLGVMGQIRRLYARDRTDPNLLLAMATTGGMTALDLPAQSATFAASTPAQLALVRFDPLDPVDPLTQALQNGYPVRPSEPPEPDER